MTLESKFKGQIYLKSVLLLIMRTLTFFDEGFSYLAQWLLIVLSPDQEQVYLKSVLQLVTHTPESTFIFMLGFIVLFWAHRGSTGGFL